MRVIPPVMNLRSAEGVLAALTLIVGAPSLVAAQGRTVDEGIFVISRNGTPVGRESFRIVRGPSASGDVYRATAQLSIGDRKVVPDLSADSTGSTLAYRVSVLDGSEMTVSLQARTRPGRFSSLMKTPQGEASKDYVVPQGVVVLDDEISHQIYFVGLSGRRSGALTVIDPRGNSQVQASLESAGFGPVEVGGRTTQASHFILTAPGFARREFWLDRAGLVLKVAIPERGIVAQRDEIPR